MKDLTIVVYDYANNNFNLELNHYFAKNLEMYEQLKQQLDIVVIAADDSKYTFNPKYLEAFDLRTTDETLDVTLKSINSNYILLMDSQSVLSLPLVEIIGFVKQQTADLVFSTIKKDANLQISTLKTKADKQLFGRENFKEISSLIWQLDLNGTLIKTETLKNLGQLKISNAIHSRLLLNQLLLSNSKFELLQKNIVRQRNIIMSEIQFENLITSLFNDYQIIVDRYFDQLSQEQLRNLSMQFLNDLIQLDEIATNNKRIQLKKYRQLLKTFKEQYRNPLLSNLTIFERQQLTSLLKRKLNRELIKRKYYSLIQQGLKQMPKKENKVVFVNQSQKFEGELKYYIRQIVSNKENKLFYFNTDQKIKGIKSFGAKRKYKYYYHLHTASEIIYFDHVVDNFIGSNKQEVIEIFGQLTNLKYQPLQKNYSLLADTSRVESGKYHLQVINQFRCPNDKIRTSMQNLVTCEVTTNKLASETFFTKHVSNPELIKQLRDKYKQTDHKTKILYPICDLPYHQYIDIKKINSYLKANEVLVLVPMTKEYTLTNIHKQAYILCENNTDIIEMALICNGIVDTNTRLVPLFKKDNRRVVDIEYDNYLNEELIGEY